MKRILVLGSGAAGKSTLSGKLGEMLDLKVFHLDLYHYKPGWKPRSDEEWEEVVEDLIKEDSWIMDGDYIDTLDMRLQRADTVIFLDINPLVCTYRVFKRLLQYQGKTRKDLPEGCEESFDWDFSKWVIFYRLKNRSRLMNKLDKVRSEKKIISLKNSKAVKLFLASLQ